MAYSIDDPTIILAVLVLLVLSIVTVEFCRRDKLNLRKFEDRFLFTGKTFLHSFVSNVGSIFSVTYFFGATFIYACVLNAWAIVTMFCGFGVGALLITKTLRTMNNHLTLDESVGNRANLLLTLMKKTHSERDYRILVQSLGIIYFALLVEEFAVSRLVLNTLFPSHFAIAVLLLTMIAVVIYSYLSLGGFRAVLNSDLVQGVVLTAFVVMLVYLILKGQPSEGVAFSLSWPGHTMLLPMLFFGFLLITWLTVSVDSYSRLNFQAKATISWKYRYRLVYLSLISTFVVVLVGMLFAISASGTIGPIETPSAYTKATMDVFFQSQHPAVAIVVLVGLFCMMFTTIDTLLITALQLGFHVGSKIINRRNLSTVLLVAITCSAIIPGDAVSAVGIFMASLLIIPFSAVIRELFPGVKRLWPHSNGYFIPSALLSLVIFAANYSRLETAFSLHYQIPALVVTSVLAAVVGWQVVSKTWELWRSHVN
jgi:hypothetical protein